VKTFKHNVCDIEWYCEVRGSGPQLVLVPSGEGDCGNFAQVAAALADEFNVLTFDMPGFSRSSWPPNFDQVNAAMLADQVAGLISSLDFGPASFYGCSSGGQVVLSLVADHPETVCHDIMHEAALVQDFIWPDLMAEQSAQLNKLDRAGIVVACKDWFRNQMNYDGQAWDALGEEYHQRLEQK
jgi:pimeloyl-ACP methyl ester carboxylesterase